MVVVRALRHLRLPQAVQHLLLARQARVAQAVLAPALARPRVHRLPPVLVHVTARHAMARPVVTTRHAIVALPPLAMISPHVRNLWSKVLAKVHRSRRSCTKSQKAIASRRLINSTNCQAVHVARNPHC